MANEKGWNEDELRVLEDAVDFHGQLSDRIIDDLADTLRKSPQAVKSMARRIRTRMRRALLNKDNPSATDTTGDIGAFTGTEPVGIVAEARPVIKRRTKAVDATSPPTVAPAPEGAPTAPIKARGAKPYTELVKALEELDILCADAKKARNRAEAANKALSEAEARIRAKQAEVQKAFPAAKSLVESTLGRYN